MAKPIFNFNMGENTTSSAKDEIAKIESQEYYNLKFIPYEEIEPNLLNDYPINDIEELAEEIKEFGLLHPLGVILNTDPALTKKYRLYSGERRHTAIGLLLKEDPSYPPFKNGIPCIVEKKEQDPITEEIKLILANKQREMTEEFKRKKAARLLTLYKEKAKRTGEKINPIKQVANDLGVGERQIRRYDASEKLIPELREAFEQSKFNLENAASIGNMDEESQRLILKLLEDKQQIGKKELEEVKNERDLLRTEIANLSQKIQDTSEETKRLRDLVKEKEDILKKTKVDEEQLRTKLQEELQKNSPSQDSIKLMEEEIKRLEEEKQLLETEKEETEKVVMQKEASILDLKVQLKNVNSTEIPEELKAQLKEEATIASMEKDLDKKLQEYSISLKNFMKKYNKNIKNEEFLKKISRITDSINRN